MVLALFICVILPLAALAGAHWFIRWLEGRGIDPDYPAPWGDGWDSDGE